MASSITHPHLWTVFILWSCLCFVGVKSIGCVDNNGRVVDWFIVYKLPRIHNSEHESVRNGVGQLYMDVNNQQWTLLDQSIDDSDHAIYNTLQHVYTSSKQDVAYILYNDETPMGNVSYECGHTKGDVCFNKSSGFWLIHSVPKFPPPVKYAYPDSGKVYGQTFLCVTFKYDVFNTIGKQLLYNYPQIYDYNLPESFEADNENVRHAIDGGHIEAEPWYNSVSLMSLKGQEFTSFAKFSKYGQDIYDAWIAPHFSSNLFVESWLKGPGALPSNCSTKYYVYNIRSITMLGESFSSFSDHAKWTITDNAAWICIGDINREEHQKYRAGGTVCAKLGHISDAFHKAIDSVQKCDTSTAALTKL